MQKNYSLFLVFIFGLIFSGALTACQPSSDSELPNNLETPSKVVENDTQEDNIKRLEYAPLSVEFELPPGWRKVENIPGYVSLYKDFDSLKLETIPNAMFKGDEQDAYDYIDEYYDYLTRPKNEPAEREVLQIELPSGHTIFTDLSLVEFPEREDQSTFFTFAKDGYVIPMYFSGNIENHLEEIDFFIRSLQFTYFP